MATELFLGIDTSNYTTSLSLVAYDGTLIANLKEPLPVKAGERGLRQSDALFAHTVNLPKLTERLTEHLTNGKIVAVGVSDKPRNAEGSYMPCFLSGVASAASVSATLGVPMYRFSHQCGHLMAAIFGSGNTSLLSAPFLAYHLSGGTSELLHVTPVNAGFDCEIIGGTLDLNCGQVIDRAGVAMGLKFPCGAELDRLAQSCKEKIALGVSVKDTYANFSGVENQVDKLIAEGKDLKFIALYVLTHIIKAVDKMTDNALKRYEGLPVLFSGGVSSNSMLKSKMQEKYGASFASPALSADNAVGIAELARRAHLGI